MTSLHVDIEETLFMAKSSQILKFEENSTQLAGGCCSGHHSELLLKLVTVGIPSDFGCCWNLDPS